MARRRRSSEVVRIRVECYAGYRGDEEPRAFIVGEVRHVVTTIDQRWRDPDGDFFRVRAEDDHRCTLRHDRADDYWELLESPPLPW